jgi:transposase-like protein
MPSGRPWWTAYRKLLVETALARGESRERIAARLGITARQVSAAIRNHGLKPRELLAESADD